MGEESTVDHRRDHDQQRTDKPVEARVETEEHHRDHAGDDDRHGSGKALTASERGSGENIGWEEREREYSKERSRREGDPLEDWSRVVT